MNVPDKFHEYFTDEQIDLIQEALNFRCRSSSVEACRSIMGSLLLYWMIKEQKNNIGPTATAKRKLARVASAAKTLVNLLRDEDVKLCQDEELQSAISKISELRVLNKTPLWGNDDVPKYSITSMLEQISKNANMLLADDELFRGYYYLPPHHLKAHNVETYTIWTCLFRIWEQNGRTVAATIDGPLHRFVKVVHEIAGLAYPEGETLADAVEAWKASPQRHAPENSAWCYSDKV